MKNYAKWLIILLCGATFLGGCDSTKEKDKQDQTIESDANDREEDSENTPDTEPTKAPDDTMPEVTPEPTEAPAEPTVTEAPVEESEFPIISIRPHHKVWYADDQTTSLLMVDDFSLAVDNAGFDALQDTFRELHPGIIDQNYEEILLWATEHYTNSGDSFWGYSASYSASLARCDSNVASLRIVYSDYTGGAHGMYAYFGESYDVKTGKLLQLADIVRDVEGFYPLAVDYLTEALYEEYEDGLFSDYASQVAATIVPENEPNWYMTGAGIVISFSPYEVGPYAMGAPEITLPYEIFGEYLQEMYCLPQGEFVAQISANQDISDVIGSSDPVYIEISDYDDWGRELVLIHSGSTSIEVGQYSYTSEKYITRHSNGRCFLIISGDYMSGDYETRIYDISNGVVRECAYLPNAYPGNRTISPTKWEMQIRLDLLGTYAGGVLYNLSSNGEFTRVENYYSVQSNYALEIIKPLPVVIDSVETTLPVGEKIYVVGTNNEDTIYFQIDGTNQFGTISFTRESTEWVSIHINGLPETEYFKSLPYAG